MTGLGFGSGSNVCESSRFRTAEVSIRTVTEQNTVSFETVLQMAVVKGSPDFIQSILPTDVGEYCCTVSLNNIDYIPL